MKKQIRRAGITTPFTYLTKPYKLRDLHSNIQMALYKKRTISPQNSRHGTRIEPATARQIIETYAEA